MINVPDPVPLPNEPKRSTRSGNARFLNIATDEPLPYAEPLTTVCVRHRKRRISRPPDCGNNFRAHHENCIAF